jgi:hypothetical protein
VSFSSRGITAIMQLISFYGLLFILTKKKNGMVEIYTKLNCLGEKFTIENIVANLGEDIQFNNISITD